MDMPAGIEAISQKLEYHQFLCSLSGEEIRSLPRDLAIQREIAIDASDLAFLRQRASPTSPPNSGRKSACSSTSSGILYIRGSQRRNAFKTPVKGQDGGLPRSRPLPETFDEIFDGSSNPEGRLVNPSRRCTSSAKPLVCEIPVDGPPPTAPKIKGRSTIVNPSAIAQPNDSISQHISQNIQGPQPEISNNQELCDILPVSKLLPDPQSPSPGSVEKEPISPEFRKKHIIPDPQTPCRVGRNDERDIPIDPAVNAKVEANANAQLPRVKRHSCLVSLANDQRKKDREAAFKKKLTLSDYHATVKTLSSDVSDSASPQRTQGLRRTDLQESTLDGPADRRVDFDSMSQTFMIGGNRINYANANFRRVLVTGGAGFIGSHLVEKLLDLGNRVVVMDNLLTGSLKNLDEFKDDPRLVFINHDILNPLPKRLVVDEVYHLACPSSPFFWHTNLIDTFNIIIEGTRNVLEFAQKSGAKLLVASSTEVYGDPQPGIEVQAETYNGNVDCFTERASHDEAKRAAEALCCAYQAERKIKIHIARIGSTYGPRMPSCDGSMVSSFMSAVAEGVELHIAEPSRATRTILYVDDCVNGLVKLMNSSYHGPLNIAGDDVVTVQDLFAQLNALVANPSKAIPWNSIEFQPDAGNRRPVNAAAFVNLGWHPTVKAEEGLKNTVKWFTEEKRKTSKRRAERVEQSMDAHRVNQELLRRQSTMGTGNSVVGDYISSALPFSRLLSKSGGTTGGGSSGASRGSVGTFGGGHGQRLGGGRRYNTWSPNHASGSVP